MEHGGFFRRKPLGFTPSGGAGGYVPVEAVNIDAYLYAPVLAGHWRQHELWDGTYTLDDLLDIQEVMTVHNENEERARAAAEERRRLS